MNEPDPDHLLKSLEIEMTQARARNSHRGTNRNTFRIISFVVLLIGIVAALAVLQYLVSEMAELKPHKKAPDETTQPK